MTSPFSHFAAIDWSGAKGTRHKGIAIAVASAANTDAPILIRPERPWSRMEVLEWIRSHANGPERWLIGMDFSFAPPFVQRGAYLPGSDTPSDGRSFWAHVDRLTSDDADLGAASFLEHAYRPHFYFGASDGRKADYMHLRACELAFNARGGGKPSSIFDVVGAAQVAKASFSGMRLLHHLGKDAAIWPFDDPANRACVVVEIYCRAFIRMAGLRGLKLRSDEQLNKALCALSSDPAPPAVYSDHETDAFIAAAGLRLIASQADYWAPAGLTPQISRTEGWTFGVD